MESAIAWKVLDANLRPHSDQPFRLTVETTLGGFFSRQNRDTDRLEWQETYRFAPLRGRGRHLAKIGMVFARNSYHGWQRFAPVEVLRASGQVAERSIFGPDTFASVQQNELSGFVQDRWNVWSRLTVDAGVRFARDSVVRESNLAPRLGMAWLLTTDGRTVLRVGIGAFYDRVNLNTASFLQFPEGTVTRFSPGGAVVQSYVYQSRLGGALHNPRSIAWSAQLDRELLRNLYLRLGYQQRNTAHDFVVQPLHTSSGDFLQLDNSGRNRYREFELTTHYRWGENSQLTASYVRSATFGDLNNVIQFYGNVPGALIRPNERSLLPFDAPNRLLFWGEFRLPFKLDFSPVLDIHTGFPHSIVNEERDFVGARNRAGRSPRFASRDVQLTRQFHIPFFGKKYKVRAGMVVRVKYTFPGKKEFEVVSASGSGIVQRLVLRRMNETEKKTSEDGEAREHTRITPENYQFQWLGRDVLDGRPCYRLAVEPRRKTPLLFRGVVWVDAENSAVVRIEGSPAKSPSFWTRKIHFRQRYAKVGPFWLPVSNESRSEVRIFGDSETSIEYYDYQINQPPAKATTGSEAGLSP